MNSRLTWPALLILAATSVLHTQQFTARRAIERLQQATGVQPAANTVATIKGGDPDEKVTGIATKFLDTYVVFEKAADGSHNLIVTHEPTFYTHTDDKSVLGNDPVQARRPGRIRQCR